MFASRVPNKSNKLAGQCAAKLCTLLEAHLCGCRYKWPDFSRLHSSLAVLHKAVRIKGKKTNYPYDHILGSPKSAQNNGLIPQN